MPVFQINFSARLARSSPSITTSSAWASRVTSASMTRPMRSASTSPSEVVKLGPFELLCDSNPATGIPTVTWRIREGEDPGYTLFDLADRLRARGWQVPAYTLTGSVLRHSRAAHPGPAGRKPGHGLPAPGRLPGCREPLLQASDQRADDEGRVQRVQSPITCAGKRQHGRDSKADDRGRGNLLGWRLRQGEPPDHRPSRPYRHLSCHRTQEQNGPAGLFPSTSSTLRPAVSGCAAATRSSTSPSRRGNRPGGGRRLRGRLRPGGGSPGLRRCRRHGRRRWCLRHGNRHGQGHNRPAVVNDVVPEGGKTCITVITSMPPMVMSARRRASSPTRATIR